VCRIFVVWNVYRVYCDVSELFDFINIITRTLDLPVEREEIFLPSDEDVYRVCHSGELGSNRSSRGKTVCRVFVIRKVYAGNWNVSEAELDAFWPLDEERYRGRCSRKLGTNPGTFANANPQSNAPSPITREEETSCLGRLGGLWAATLTIKFILSHLAGKMCGASLLFGRSASHPEYNHIPPPPSCRTKKYGLVHINEIWR